MTIQAVAACNAQTMPGRDQENMEASMRVRASAMLVPMPSLREVIVSSARLALPAVMGRPWPLSTLLLGTGGPASTVFLSLARFPNRARVGSTQR